MEQVNRSCKGCRLSKLKCDLGSVARQQIGTRCSRCTRLNLDCVRESRGNSGRSRLKADGICALKRGDGTNQSSSTIEMLTKIALTTTRPQRVLAVPLLRFAAQEAWYRNDTKLMAWVLEEAAARDLPLSDFAPSLFSSAPPGQLEPTGTGTPPPFIRALLGGGYSDAFGVAFVQSETHIDWIANDSFDQRICSRRSMHEARRLPSCSASALFSPESEVEPFEHEVVGALFAALEPGHSTGHCASSSTELHLDAEPAEDEPAEMTNLYSEIVDRTSGWRLRQNGDDAFISCEVVMRCAVLRGGAEVWMVASYSPLSHSDGSWVTVKDVPPRETVTAPSSERRSTKSPPRKRRAGSHCDAPAQLPTCDKSESSLLAETLVSQHADALFEHLQATSTEEVLRILDEEQALGEDALAEGGPFPQYSS